MIIMAVIVGIFAALCLAFPLASVYWFRVNPSISELQAVAGRMTMTEAEAAQMSQMIAVGAAVDFVITLMMFACPAIVVGGLIGLASGVLWYPHSQKAGTDL